MFIFGHYRFVNDNLIEDELVLVPDQQTAEDAMQDAIDNAKLDLQNNFTDVTEHIRYSSVVFDKNNVAREEVILEGTNRYDDITQKDVFFVYEPTSLRKRGTPRLKAVANLSPRLPVANISLLPISKAEAQEAIKLRHSTSEILDYLRSLDYKRFNLNALEYLAQFTQVPGRTLIIKNLKGDEKKLALYNAILDL